ncbi:DUF3574 domain-containing protein [Rhodopseudomonas sp. P2A-2r]|uniref:DUF3574 domain-containing protein n=1 Tax=unclassified Rhodopseudomonas TaxID=2638247 RepID=UPI0022344956|nr:DUF3574 domain-containing protein [Rhodopseudomonas sp. P2A-2r]UZE51529.1 DUF3574 domain-containing protein [Rhodopseudomonas sp. P2A-2r]
MNRRTRAAGACLAALTVAAALSGCASLPQSCVAPARMMATADMMFGRDIENGRAVSDRAFADFLAAEVTPRFPDGLTVIDARGQWRDGAGALLREPSKLLLLVFDDDARKRADLVAIADAYKRKFRQQSVLTSVRAGCVSF